MSAFTRSVSSHGPLGRATALMQITALEPIVLRRDRVDTGRADGTQDAFLIRVHTDEGIVGIGEADTSPYLARTMIEMPSSHSIARGLAELLVGEDPLAIDRCGSACGWARITTVVLVPRSTS